MILAATAAATPAAAAPTHLLRLGASRSPEEYVVRTHDQQVRVDVPKTRTEVLYETLERFRRSASTEAGRLKVTLTPISKSLKVNGIQVRGVPFSTDPGTLIQDPRGGGAGSEGPRLWPTLPEKAVGPGHTWETKAPPTEDFPLELRMRHRFDKLKDFQGQRCAVIVSEGETKGDVTERGARVIARIDMQVLLSLEDGQPLRVYSKETVKTLFQGEVPGRPAGKTERTMTRVVERDLPKKD